MIDMLTKFRSWIDKSKWKWLMFTSPLKHITVNIEANFISGHSITPVLNVHTLGKDGKIHYLDEDGKEHIS